MRHLNNNPQDKEVYIKLDILSTEFMIKINKKDAEVLAITTEKELLLIKNKLGDEGLKKCGRLIELNRKFSKLSNVDPFVND